MVNDNYKKIDEVINDGISDYINSAKNKVADVFKIGEKKIIANINNFISKIMKIFKTIIKFLLKDDKADHWRNNRIAFIAIIIAAITFFADYFFDSQNQVDITGTLFILGCSIIIYFWYSDDDKKKKRDDTEI